MDLLEFISQRIHLTDEQTEIFQAGLTRKPVTKGNQISHSSSLSKKVFFIESGLARTYYLEEGKDITHFFFDENSFYLSVESVFYNEPSLYEFEMLESGVICSFDYELVEQILPFAPQLEKTLRIILIGIVNSFSHRLHSVLFRSAMDRYQTMLKEQPHIIQRAPLGSIASYLGMTQQTLSVIRGRTNQ